MYPRLLLRRTLCFFCASFCVGNGRLHLLRLDCLVGPSPFFSLVSGCPRRSSIGLLEALSSRCLQTVGLRIARSLCLPHCRCCSVYFEGFSSIIAYSKRQYLSYRYQLSK